MAETVCSVSEVRFFYFVIYHFQSFLFRMVEMIEKFKEEEPDNDFAELDVTERIETKFIVRKTIKMFFIARYFFSGKLVLCS